MTVPCERRVLTRSAHPISTGFLVTIGVVLAALLTLAVVNLATVLLSIVMSMFLALALDPAVRALERRGIRRGWGVFIVAAGFLLLVVAVVLVVVPSTARQLSSLIASAPQAIEDIQATEWFGKLDAWIGIDLETAVQSAFGSVVDLSTFVSVGGGVLRAGMGVVGAISTGSLVVVLTLYFVTALDATKEALYRLVVAHRRAQVREITDQITASVGHAVAGGLTMSAINAAVTLVLMLIIGSPMAGLLALAAYVITLIPMIGSVLFLVIGTIAALFVSPLGALIFAVGYLIYIQIESYYVTPRVVGNAVAVPGVLVIIGATIGATLLGLFGAVVAIPITSSILIILREVVIPRQDAQVQAPE